MFQTILPCLQAGKRSAAALPLSWGVHLGEKSKDIWLAVSKNSHAQTDRPKGASAAYWA